MFTAAGDQIAAAGSNQRLNVWSVDIDATIEHICRDLGATLQAEEWERFVRGSRFIDPC